MITYRIKITMKEKFGSKVSYLTEGYGWHPSIAPKVFYNRHDALMWQAILKVEDCYECLYTGKVEIETVPSEPTKYLWLWYVIAGIVAVELLIITIAFICK